MRKTKRHGIYVVLKIFFFVLFVPILAINLHSAPFITMQSKILRANCYLCEREREQKYPKIDQFTNSNEYDYVEAASHSNVCMCRFVCNFHKYFVA